MSDANETEWSGKTGRKEGTPGMTRGAGVQSGLSHHSPIKDSVGAGDHGQGQRPATSDMGGSMTHGGKTFKNHR